MAGLASEVDEIIDDLLGSTSEVEASRPPSSTQQLQPLVSPPNTNRQIKFTTLLQPLLTAALLSYRAAFISTDDAASYKAYASCRAENRDFAPGWDKWSECNGPRGEILGKGERGEAEEVVEGEGVEGEGQGKGEGKEKDEGNGKWKEKDEGNGEGSSCGVRSGPPRRENTDLGELCRNWLVNSNTLWERIIQGGSDNGDDWCENIDDQHWDNVYGGKQHEDDGNKSY
ncbi:hypothetical protein EJ08DRAFT_692727 [Tothia fuscella]|uniref:Uncharacterized protein n=1 Tax=Tothia fuscella TaxID=1048955 RepID=A0A9P4P1A7_9PEZI|nr:hypothetical protein EJ08DRAFT_692727 [Tothia fuscella]